MQTNRTLVFSLLFVLLGLSLMLGSPRGANAGTLTVPQWEEMAGYIDGYIQSQYDAAYDTANNNNEYGFVYPPALYKSRVDNNGGTGDGTLCGVGDDMKDRPVLVDNLLGSGVTLIPGTSIRNQWSSTSTTIGGMSTAVLAAVKAKVNAHREAGFSTDISIY